MVTENYYIFQQYANLHFQDNIHNIKIKIQAPVEPLKMLFREQKDIILWS